MARRESLIIYTNGPKATRPVVCFGKTRQSLHTRVTRNTPVQIFVAGTVRECRSPSKILQVDSPLSILPRTPSGHDDRLREE